MSDNAPEDLRSPREKASKIPSWIMVGFILGALTFYTVHDYLSIRTAPLPTPPATGSALASSGTQQPALSAQPSATASASPAVPPDTTTKASPLLDNSKQMTLFAMDAVFRRWAINAMWDYNTTQVVFWNPAEAKFNTAVEIFRVGTDETGYDYYYRRMDHLTRPLIKDDTRPDSPILFTESEDATQRRKQKEADFWRR